MEWKIDINWVLVNSLRTKHWEDMKAFIDINNYIDKYGSDPKADKIFLGYIEDQLLKLCPKLPSRKKIIAEIKKFQSYDTDVWEILRDSMEFDYRTDRAIILLRLGSVVMGLITFSYNRNHKYMIAGDFYPPWKMPTETFDQTCLFTQPTTMGSFIGITKTIPMLLASECGYIYPSLTDLFIPRLISLAQTLKIEWLLIHPLPVMKKILMNKHGFTEKLSDFIPKANVESEYAMYSSDDNGKSWDIHEFDVCYRVPITDTLISESI